MGHHHTDDVRRGLAEAGQRLAQGRRDHQAAIADIAEWLRRGVPDALPLSEAARLAGITRRTAYRLRGERLREDGTQQ